MIGTRWKAQGLVVLAAFFSAGFWWPGWAVLGSEQPDSRQFLDTYRAALLRLQAACGSGHLEGVYTSRWFGARADRPVREAALDMAYSSDGHREKHVLIRRDQASAPYFERVFLPRNGRTLILERLDPERPFFIRWISKPSEAPDNLAPTDRRDTIARAAYSIGGGFLIPSILDAPSFQIIELRRVDRDGASLVRVAFKSRSDAAKSLPELDGWVLLDPRRDFALRAHEVRIAWPASPNSLSLVSGTVRYADGAAAGLLPEEVTLVDRFRRDEQASEHRIHFRARRRASESPSADTFTLAAYDLGDYPWGVERQPEHRGSSQLTVLTPVLFYDRPAPKTSVDLSFQLTNSGSKAVRVVGMRFGCAAILPAEELPCRIEPGQTKRLTLKLQASSETGTGETRFPLYLYTTAPGQAQVELTLVGRKSTQHR
jgi:hypothetical protein